MAEVPIDNSTKSFTLLCDMRDIIKDQAKTIKSQTFQIELLELQVEKYRKERDDLREQLDELTKHFLKVEDFPYTSQDSHDSTDSTFENSAQRSESVPLDNSPSTSLTRSDSGRFNSPTSSELKKIRSLKREKSIRQRREDDVLIKRSRAYSNAYELSSDLQNKQVEMLQKKYGGRLITKRAATKIQEAFRQYSMTKNFEKIRSAKSENRMSRRFTKFKDSPEWNKMFSKCVVSLDFEPGESTDERFNKSVDIGEVALVNKCLAELTESVKHDIVEDSAKTSIPSLNESNELSPEHKPMSLPCSPEHKPEIRVTDHDVITETKQDLDKSHLSSGQEKQNAESQKPNIEDNLDSKRGFTLVYTIHLHDESSEEQTIEREPEDVKTTHKSVQSVPIDPQSVSTDMESITKDIPSEATKHHDLSVESSPETKQVQNVSCEVPSVVVATPEGKKTVIEGVDNKKATPERTSVPPAKTSSKKKRRTREEEDFMKPQKAVVRVIGSQEQVGSPVWRRKMLDSTSSVSSGAISGVSTGMSSGSGSNRSSICSISSTSTIASVKSDISTSSSNSDKPAKISNGVAKPMDKCESFESLSTDGSCQSICNESFQGSSDSISLMSESISVSEVEAVHGRKLSPAPSISHTNVTLMPLTEERKRRYRVGLNLFNKKPEKGMKFLIDNKFLENSPPAVAKFLLTAKGVSKQMIGEYLGNLQKQFNMEVLDCYVDDIDLIGMPIDEALRKFQTYYRMPGEAQKIERLMEAFGQRYCMCNPQFVSRFNNPDTVFILAFAIIMLNTDQHNPNVKPERKMKLEDFVKNLRDIDNGDDVDRELLVGIYERIRRSEFQPGVDHVTQVRKLEESIVGNKPILAEPNRRLVCYVRLFEVYDPTKKDKLHQREIFLFNDMIVITKILSKRKTAITYNYKKSFPLHGITVLLFESQYYQYGVRLAKSEKILINFSAQSEEDRARFVSDLKEAVLEMHEMEDLRIGAELQKQTLTLKRSLGSGSDSGVGLDTDSIANGDLRDSMDSLTVTDRSNSLKRSALSNSLMDLKDTSGKKGRRDSAGSLDSGMVSSDL
uniref:IQ motif and SEC7 domain-containing protein 2-like n=1 Tax=Saccoglossus kowalevskii TaxID=10224 RepID=A0ABM0M7J7_SACKO|nr:PREDICTED: IQ motif and SEC7 domain-containing protein 2-like [Saccoglossus kowalevskii]